MASLSKRRAIASSFCNSTQLSLHLSHPAAHFNRLHAAQAGTVVVWDRTASTGHAWQKLRPGEDTDAFLSRLLGQPDCYVTVNEFRGWRLTRLVTQLRACFVDIDPPSGAPAPSLEYLLAHLRDQKMPPPSLAVSSGRGWHLYWLLEPAGRDALPRWQAIQNALIESLRPLGADPVARDCARVLRLAGTINAKNGAEVLGTIVTGWSWTLTELETEVLGDVPKLPRTKAKVRDLTAARATADGPRRAPSVGLCGIYRRWFLVSQDLVLIAKAHPHGIPDGHRDVWLHLTTVALSWFMSDPERIAEEIGSLARKWTTGLTTDEIRRAGKCAIDRAFDAAAGKTHRWRGVDIDPRYQYKRETLWQLLSPIIPASLVESLRAIVPAEIRQRREKERQARRDRVAEGRRTSHRAGRRSLGQPWLELGISRRTYFRRQRAKKC